MTKLHREIAENANGFYHHQHHRQKHLQCEVRAVMVNAVMVTQIVVIEATESKNRGDHIGLDC